MSKIINGGRSLTVGGIKLDTLTAYKPSWTKEYGKSFTAWDGRLIQPLKGVRFSLAVTAYGLSLSDINALKRCAAKDIVPLVCAEYEGDVIITGISPEIRASNFLGTYYTISLELTAAALDTSDSGSL